MAVITSGKRKTAVAYVKLTPGTGKITVNKKPFEQYFKIEDLRKNALKAFALTNTINKYDIFATLQGGGLSGQSDALRHAVAQALVKEEEEFKPIIKENKLLTRDPRQVERKKPGLKKARKAPQFTKR